MKPEPLRTKGKRRIEMTTAEWIGRLLMPVDTFPTRLREGCGEILQLRQEKEIKSAVEWLKNILRKDLEIQLKAGRKGQSVKLDFALHLIDEAFEDVTQPKANTK